MTIQNSIFKSKYIFFKHVNWWERILRISYCLEETVCLMNLTILLCLSRSFFFFPALSSYIFPLLSSPSCFLSLFFTSCYQVSHWHGYKSWLSRHFNPLFRNWFTVRVGKTFIAAKNETIYSMKMCPLHLAEISHSIGMYSRVVLIALERLLICVLTDLARGETAGSCLAHLFADSFNSIWWKEKACVGTSILLHFFSWEQFFLEQ